MNKTITGKQLLSALLFLALMATGLWGKEGQKPERLVLTWESDPAATQSVTWRTYNNADDPEAQVTLVLPWAKDFEKNAVTVEASTEELTTEDGVKVFHHTARFVDLQPGKHYAYRVGQDDEWSEWNVFKTAGLDSEPFSFLYLGDVQNEIFDKASPLLRSAWARAPESRFILIAGDLVNHGREDAEWSDFFSAFGFISRMVPIVPAPGNHDTARKETADDGILDIDPLYLAHFALPMNGPEPDDFKETAYYMDYQSARIVVFNSNNVENQMQLRWLKTVLQSNTKPWLIVTYHHPVYSTGKDRDNKKLRGILTPIFEKYGVDLVLQGHDHYYGRTGKVVQDKTVDNNAPGPVYAVSVSGPKMYGYNKTFSHLMRKSVGETQLYQVIKVSPEDLHYESWTLDGRKIDAFTLEQNEQGTELVEE